MQYVNFEHYKGVRIVLRDTFFRYNETEYMCIYRRDLSAEIT